MCDLITWPWPRQLLSLPFAIRLGLCLLCFPGCMAIYLWPSLPTADNGVVLTLSMGLASWLFTKWGACCNFFGYITLAVALYLPLLRRYQRVIRWTFVVYTAITIILWFLINGSHPNQLAYIDKPAEVALIILLLIEDQRARREVSRSQG